MTIQSPIALGLAALAVTTLAMAMGTVGPAGAAKPAVAIAADEPFTCDFTAREEGGGVTILARLTARDAFQGRYDLSIRRAGGGAAIDQSGDVLAAPGETVTLGQSTLSGRAADYDATLTMTSGGQTTTCPLTLG